MKKLPRKLKKAVFSNPDPPSYANGMKPTPVIFVDDPNYANGMKPVPVYMVGGGLESNPPTGKKKIINIYWDQDTEEVVIEIED